MEGTTTDAGIADSRRMGFLGRLPGRGMMRGILVLVSGVVLLACNGDASEKPSVGLANPASVNCEKLGGELRIEKNGSGAEYGVCVFEDNRQCEEWALFRGNCPKGGLRVTGYTTPASRYCAIQGGTYIVTTSATKTAPEKGNCELPDGGVCSAQQLFDGECS